MSAKDKLRAAIEQARKTPGKEPFDIEKFRAVYDITIDTGDGPLTPELEEDFEAQYYLLARSVKTLQEYAVYRQNMRDNDAG